MKTAAEYARHIDIATNQARAYEALAEAAEKLMERAINPAVQDTLRYEWERLSIAVTEMEDDADARREQALLDGYGYDEITAATEVAR